MAKEPQEKNIRKELDRCKEELEEQRGELEKCREEMEEQKEELEKSKEELEEQLEEHKKKLEICQGELEEQREELEQCREELEAIKRQMAYCNMKMPKLVLTWRQGTQAPSPMATNFGAAVVHGNTAYFSHMREVYSYTLPENKWTPLQKSKYMGFGLAVVNDKLTTIGGLHNCNVLDSLLSLEENSWEELLPPMPAPQEQPSAITITSHLVVAGGRNKTYDKESKIQVLNVGTLQWNIAKSSLTGNWYNGAPMALCGGYLYISNSEGHLYSCSVEKLLQSCEPACSSTDLRWALLANVSGSTLVTLRGHLLSVGGFKDKHGGITGAIHCYDRATDSWTFMGQEIPAPGGRALAVVFPSSNELMVVSSSFVDIASLD